MKKARKRERPLGSAIGIGVAVAFGVGLIIFLVQMAIPGSAMHNFWRLLQGNNSATLAGSDLYQQFAGQIQREETLFATPLALFCGGLALGRLAPRRGGRRRALLAGLGLAVGILALSFGFLWADAVYQYQLLVNTVGGTVMHSVVTRDFLLRQAAWDCGWIIVCILGTYVGLLWRDSQAGGEGAPARTPRLRTAKP